MRLIARAMGRYKGAVALCVVVKLFATLSELMLPYILEHIIDTVAPRGDLPLAVFWGALMFAAALVCRQLNVAANRRGVRNAHNVSYDIRQALFQKTASLSGSQFDAFGLPSLISRMTSDSYNVQSAAQQLQTLCVRAPMLLIGGVAVTLVMDASLALVLVAMLPVLVAVVLAVSARGLPMYRRVQHKLDGVVRIMRENITGIRVVKALSKTQYEKARFRRANDEMAASDIAAGTVMAIPSPFMQLCLNGGLTLVVLIGAGRVNDGTLEPGVILAFLTYFNMIAMGVMGLSRIFMTMSRAMASADRIDQVLQTPPDQRVLSPGEAKTPAGGGFLRFEDVSFSYGEGDGSAAGFAGEEREKALSGISFFLERGESLGIIGPTGCGKSTVVSLLMRFYDASEGGVFVDGRDVRAYEPDALRRKFGVCFQNDMVFQDSLRANVDFGRDVGEQALRAAVEAAQAAEYIDELADGLDHQADIKGANLSGGQKQRLLVARALAASPDILILDDSSSALDYKTDAAMRRAIARHCAGSALIMVAQRVSSVMGMTRILVMDNGRCLGCGTHEELLKTCPAYLETYRIQMGEMA
ncbi:MAG: ABC transporter ATP-binding protein/permease [Oscillospiraceae bacterium]|nr:ABC transporter ATP-binding protein/permease [Oscillospiraceae bacterium]